MNKTEQNFEKIQKNTRLIFGEERKYEIRLSADENILVQLDWGEMNSGIVKFDEEPEKFINNLEVCLDYPKHCHENIEELRDGYLMLNALKTL